MPTQLYVRKDMIEPIANYSILDRHIDNKVNECRLFTPLKAGICTKSD